MTQMINDLTDPNAKRYALIEGGKVVNIVKAPVDWAAPAGQTKVEVEQHAIVDIGDEHDGINFTTQKLSRVLTDEEKFENLRAERNALLNTTDWTQQGDVPDAIKTKWQTYRQELRDLPANTDISTTTTGLTDVAWPTKPT
tara:strand:- start:382 stop:804 length:423 start_codon:yes stop_codon:yes gene_type:complete